MTQTLEEIAERIIVCGEDEVIGFLQNPEVETAITACAPNECGLSVRAALERAKDRGLEHHQSEIFPKPLRLEYDIEKAQETIDFAIKRLHETKTKLVIHCYKGSDRSALIALSALLGIQGDEPDMVEALRGMYRIRPQAKLGGMQTAYAFIAGIFGQAVDSDGALYNYLETISRMVTIKYLGELAFFDEQSRRDFYSACNNFGITPPQL